MNGDPDVRTRRSRSGRKRASLESPTPIWQTLLAFGFGTIFCGVLLAVAWLNPAPSDFLVTIVRIILSVAVAGVAALIPGFLHVNINDTIRAGGALGVFIIVYFFSPGLITTTKKALDPFRLDQPPEIEAETWLKIVDSGDYGAAYDRAARLFAASTDKASFSKVFSAQRGPLGAPKTRTIYSVAPLTVLPDGRTGNFRVMGYKTLFEEFPTPLIEWITLMDEGGSWRVMSHYLAPDAFQKPSTLPPTAPK